MEYVFTWTTASKRMCKKINKIMKAYEKLGLISVYYLNSYRLGRGLGKYYTFEYSATRENSDYLTNEIANLYA